MTKNRDKGWDLLERNLQVPFSEVNTAVANAADGWQLVKTRLLVGENPGNGDFKKLSNLLNEAFRAAKKSRLPVGSMLVAADSEPADPAIGRTTPFHFSPWNWLLGLTIRPAWRRALGFAWQDTIARGLVAGQLYDY